MAVERGSHAPLARRQDAIDEQTGPDEMEHCVRLVQQRAAVVRVNERDADAVVGKTGEQFLETLPLDTRIRLVVFRRSIVRVDALDFETRQTLHPADQFARLSRRDAEPAHAGVHLDVRPHRRVQFRRDFGKQFRLGRHGNGRHHVVLHRTLHFVRKTRAEHQNRPAFADIADDMGFGQIGHTEDVRAALHQQRGDLLQSMAVGVRLDDGHDSDLRPDAMTNPSEIFAQRVQVHFRPTTIGVLHAIRRRERCGAGPL